jgi:hypothetical protein
VLAPDDKRHASERTRLAANAKRHRSRKRRGIWVLRVTARLERLIDLLVRKGLLHDHAEHDRNTIEAALTAFLDDEGRK